MGSNTVSLELINTLRLCGSITNKSELSTIENPKLGDIVVDTYNNITYLYTGSYFDEICNNECSIQDLESEKTIELKERKCPNCGAPLHMYNKYSSNVKCKYCDSIFSLEEI